MRRFLIALGGIVVAYAGVSLLSGLIRGDWLHQPCSYSAYQQRAPLMNEKGQPLCFATVKAARQYEMSYAAARTSP